MYYTPYEFPDRTPEEYRKIRDNRPPGIAIPEALSKGRLLHGSRRSGLEFLIARVSDNLTVNDMTGEFIPNQKRLYATDDPDLAIFYASIRSVCRGAWLYRASGVMPMRQYDGTVTGWEYFLSDAGKNFIARQHRWNSPNRVYFMETNGFTYDETFGEFHTARSLTDVVGSTAVYHTDLSFDVFNLPSPDSDPRIHEYYERAGTLAESRF